MNKMDQLCSILGVKLFDRFDIDRAIPNTHNLIKLRNPYFINDEGLINSHGCKDNALLAELVNGSLVLTNLNKNVLDDPI